MVEAPVDGCLVGILANPRVLPGHPLVHLTKEDKAVRDAYDRLGFARHGTLHCMGRRDPDLVDHLFAGPPADSEQND